MFFYFVRQSFEESVFLQLTLPDHNQIPAELFQLFFRFSVPVDIPLEFLLPDLASQLGLKPSYVSRILSLNNLAPDIVEAIVEGNEPDGLSIEKISRNIPEDWAEQRKLFGFPAL